MYNIASKSIVNRRTFYPLLIAKLNLQNYNASQVNRGNQRLIFSHTKFEINQLKTNAPKGFDKYYPKNKNSENAKKNSESKPKKSPQGNFSGNFFDKDAMPSLLLFAILLYLFKALLEEMGDVHEITYQSFEKYLLHSGKITNIFVVNRKEVQVLLKGNVKVPYSANPNFRKDRLKNIGNISSTSSTPSSSFEDESENTNSAEIPPSEPFIESNYFKFLIGSPEVFERKVEEAQLSKGTRREDFVPIVYKNEANLSNIFLPLLVLVGVGFALFRMSKGNSKGGINNIFNMGRSSAKKFNKEKSVKISFKDVAGVDQAKKEIMEFVEFLKNPKKFTELGAKIPKGALLSGPPGTGKTLLAKATAGEANVPFFSISGSDFIEMFVGVGASRVRDLFKEARSNAPCIVFIDEIDAVGRKRGGGRFAGSNDERESTLNQLLVEMDGFDERVNVVILAGTNRADTLDPALLRPGRFDRQITIDLPDIIGRKQIFEVHLRNLKLEKDISEYSGRLAGLTPGFSGADIENICNEAAIVAARKNLKKINLTCFEEATDRVIGGLETKKIITPEEKNIVAFHEAGHAVAGWFLEHADPLLKVTIVPRGKGSLGYAQYLPKEVFLRTKEQITDMICMALAGRASEQINFGSFTTGSGDDIKRVTQIVYQMINVFGMSEKVGLLSFPKEDTGGFPVEKPYSEHTAEAMDKEAKNIVDQAYERTLALITNYKEQVSAVAELLLKRETINHDDLVQILGKRPFESHKSYEDFIHSVMKDKTEDK